jgi:hypothetical protein
MSGGTRCVAVALHMSRRGSTGRWPRTDREFLVLPPVNALSDDLDQPKDSTGGSYRMAMDAGGQGRQSYRNDPVTASVDGATNVEEFVHGTCCDCDGQSVACVDDKVVGADLLDGSNDASFRRSAEGSYALVNFGAFASGSILSSESVDNDPSHGTEQLRRASVGATGCRGHLRRMTWRLETESPPTRAAPSPSGGRVPNESPVSTGPGNTTKRCRDEGRHRVWRRARQRGWRPGHSYQLYPSMHSIGLAKRPGQRSIPGRHSLTPTNVAHHGDPKQIAAGIYAAGCRVIGPPLVFERDPGALTSLGALVLRK